MLADSGVPCAAPRGVGTGCGCHGIFVVVGDMPKYRSIVKIVEYGIFVVVIVVRESTVPASPPVRGGIGFPECRATAVAREEQLIGQVDRRLHGICAARRGDASHTRGQGEPGTISIGGIQTLQSKHRITLMAHNMLGPLQHGLIAFAVDLIVQPLQGIVAHLYLRLPAHLSSVLPYQPTACS